MSQPPRRLFTQLTDLWLGVPQVVAHRMARTGPTPSASDRRELHRMVAEKPPAFFSSWLAFNTALWQSGFGVWTAWLGAFLPGGMPRLRHRLESAPPRIASQALAPLHRKVQANVRRLGR